MGSIRELQLEALVRERDEQLASLRDEVTRLRRYLPTTTQPDTPSLPLPVTALLLPHLTHSTAPPTGSGTTALTQRTRLLQQENDELYELLRTSETGKLKEEVRALRRVVERLEGALRESHQAIQTLSTELDKTVEALLAAPAHVRARSRSRSPPPHHSRSPHNFNTLKQPPTGPRAHAHKKARMSEPAGSGVGSSRGGASPQKQQRNNNMDVDNAKSNHPPSRPRERATGRERERERSRHNSTGGRQSSGGGGGRRSGGSGHNGGHAESGDRTLKERLGL
ncbi:hypothetical protein MKEN_00083600 [Mycena kentingensis (nom. inval.)]|nr:hypothetical protein MKEN_00083600 [Mycena kentingensis (nom. inval.)]